MAKTSSRRGRPLKYDRSAIARLLAERTASGTTYAALAARSGIPAATLAWHANRRSRSERSQKPTFVEIVESRAPKLQTETDAALRILIRPADKTREIIVPRGCDVTELQRVITALESSC